jgi:hypothetical protein
MEPLFIVHGRVLFDDDDTVLCVKAPNLDAAIKKFSVKLANEAEEPIDQVLILGAMTLDQFMENPL